MAEIMAIKSSQFTAALYSLWIWPIAELKDKMANVQYASIA